MTAWSTVRETPRTLLARTVGIAAIPSVTEYAFASPNTGADAAAARQSATRIASHIPVDQPHLAFVNSTAQAAFATLDRVAQVASYTPSVAYPNNGFGQALQTAAGAISRGIGTSMYWVQTGGYDTHSGQNTNVANGSYNGLMTTLNGGLFAFYRDMQNQGLLSDTLVIEFSEFGTTHQRERQQRNRSRRRQPDDGDGRRRPWRDLRHGAQPQSERQSHARERQSGCPLRNRFPLGLRARHRQLARWRLDGRSRREFPEDGPNFIRVP